MHGGSVCVLRGRLNTLTLEACLNMSQLVCRFFVAGAALCAAASSIFVPGAALSDVAKILFW